MCPSHEWYLCQPILDTWTVHIFVCETNKSVCVQSAGETLRDQTSGKAFSEQNMAATRCISATFSKWTLKCSLPPTSTTAWTHTSSNCSLLLPLPPPVLPFFAVPSCLPFISLYASSTFELLILSKIWRCKLCDDSPNRPPFLTVGARQRVGGV